MAQYDFHYLPLEGKITGKQVLQQTEDAINDLGNRIADIETDTEAITEAVEIAQDAKNTADNAETIANDAMDVAQAERESAQEAAQEANQAATNAANSASSASTTATQLMQYLATKEEITAPIVDPTLTISGAASDAKVTGDGIRGIETDIYIHTEVAVNATSSNWALNGSGLAKSFTGVNLVKYAVTAGERLYLRLAKDWEVDGNSNGVYQWQNSASVAGSGTNANLIGTPVNRAVDEVVTVPVGATYLITAQSASNTTNSVASISYVDPTLTVSDHAPDGKITGDIINETLGKNLNLLRYTTWEIGGVNTTTGVNAWSESRYRCDYIAIPPNTKTINLSVDSGYKYYAVVINSEKTEVLYTQSWATAVNTINVTTISGATYFRVMMQRTDNTIQTGDYVHFHAIYNPTLIEDVNNLINPVSADFYPYFTGGKNMEVINPYASSSTFKFQDGGSLIIFDATGGAVGHVFTVDTILTKAQSYGLTVDSQNFQFTGNVFRLVYNKLTKDISFEEPYSNVKPYCVVLLVKTYNTNIGGALFDYVSNKIIYDNKSAIEAINETIPSYYDTQIATVKSNVKTDLSKAGLHGESFVFITDIHWGGNYKHSPRLIKSLIKDGLVNLIINGGDEIDGSTDKTYQLNLMRDCINAFGYLGVPMITARGNHDFNSGYGTSANYFDEAEMYSAMYFQNAYMDKVYGSYSYQYYWDRKSTKTRFIVLNSGVNNIGDGICILQADIDWAANIIDNTPADYHIIVIVHAIGDYRNMTVPVEDSSAYFVYYSGASNLLTMLDGKLQTHNIEALFFGHTHFDAVVYSTGGIPLISTNSDAKWQYYGMPQPSDGTVEAQCFDVVTMDYTAKKIYLRRVGRGEDRTVTYGE